VTVFRGFWKLEIDNEHDGEKSGRFIPTEAFDQAERIFAGGPSPIALVIELWSIADLKFSAFPIFLVVKGVVRPITYPRSHPLFRPYRGFARNVQQHAAAVIRSGEIGGILSRDAAAAGDAFFNQYGRDPVISGAQQGGVVEITIPADLWNEMLRTSSISEREGYPGFSRRISTTEIRVNLPQAAAAINKCLTRIVLPDFRRWWKGCAQKNMCLASGES
jgi:hypothetical protein